MAAVTGTATVTCPVCMAVELEAPAPAAAAGGGVGESKGEAECGVALGPCGHTVCHACGVAMVQAGMLLSNAHPFPRCEMCVGDGTVDGSRSSYGAGWLSYEAVAALYGWSTSDAARAAGVSPLSVTLLARYTRAMLLAALTPVPRRASATAGGGGAAGGGDGGSDDGGSDDGGGEGEWSHGHGRGPSDPSLSRRRGGGGGGGGAGASALALPAASPALARQASVVVSCPAATCGAVFKAAPSGVAVRDTCPMCATDFCLACVAAWKTTVGPAVVCHYGLTCTAYADMVAGVAGADTARDDFLASLDAATRATIGKACPGCGIITVHYRCHGCHHAQPSGCTGCGLHYCYCCLGPWPCNAGCGFACDDVCDCPPCPTCTPAAKCRYCSGPPCPTCVGETPQAAAERLARQAAAAAAKMASTTWCGPRSGLTAEQRAVVRRDGTAAATFTPAQVARMLNAAAAAVEAALEAAVEACAPAPTAPPPAGVAALAALEAAACASLDGLQYCRAAAGAGGDDSRVATLLAPLHTLLTVFVGGMERVTLCAAAVPALAQLVAGATEVCLLVVTTARFYLYDNCPSDDFSGVLARAATQATAFLGSGAAAALRIPASYPAFSALPAVAVATAGVSLQCERTELARQYARPLMAPLLPAALLTAVAPPPAVVPAAAARRAVSLAGAVVVADICTMQDASWAPKPLLATVVTPAMLAALLRGADAATDANDMELAAEQLAAAYGVTSAAAPPCGTPATTGTGAAAAAAAAAGDVAATAVAAAVAAAAAAAATAAAATAAAEAADDATDPVAAAAAAASATASAASAAAAAAAAAAAPIPLPPPLLEHDAVVAAMASLSPATRSRWHTVAGVMAACGTPPTLVQSPEARHSNINAPPWNHLSTKLSAWVTGILLAHDLAVAVQPDLLATPGGVVAALLPHAYGRRSPPPPFVPTVLPYPEATGPTAVALAALHTAENEDGAIPYRMSCTIDDVAIACRVMPLLTAILAAAPADAPAAALVPWVSSPLLRRGGSAAVARGVCATTPGVTDRSGELAKVVRVQLGAPLAADVAAAEVDALLHTMLTLLARYHTDERLTLALLQSVDDTLSPSYSTRVDLANYWRAYAAAALLAQPAAVPTLAAVIGDGRGASNDVVQWWCYLLTRLLWDMDPERDNDDDSRVTPPVLPPVPPRPAGETSAAVVARLAAAVPSLPAVLAAVLLRVTDAAFHAWDAVCRAVACFVRASPPLAGAMTAATPDLLPRLAAAFASPFTDPYQLVSLTPAVTALLRALPGAAPQLLTDDVLALCTTIVADDFAGAGGAVAYTVRMRIQAAIAMLAACAVNSDCAVAMCNNVRLVTALRTANPRIMSHQANEFTGFLVMLFAALLRAPDAARALDAHFPGDTLLTYLLPLSPLLVVQRGSSMLAPNTGSRVRQRTVLDWLDAFRVALQWATTPGRAVADAAAEPAAPAAGGAGGSASRAAAAKGKPSALSPTTTANVLAAVEAGLAYTADVRGHDSVGAVRMATARLTQLPAFRAVVAEAVATATAAGAAAGAAAASPSPAPAPTPAAVARTGGGRTRATTRKTSPSASSRASAAAVPDAELPARMAQSLMVAAMAARHGSRDRATLLDAAVSVLLGCAGAGRYAGTSAAAMCATALHDAVAAAATGDVPAGRAGTIAAFIIDWLVAVLPQVAPAAVAAEAATRDGSGDGEGGGRRDDGGAPAAGGGAPVAGGGAAATSAAATTDDASWLPAKPAYPRAAVLAAAAAAPEVYITAATAATLTGLLATHLDHLRKAHSDVFTVLLCLAGQRKWRK